MKEIMKLPNPTKIDSFKKMRITLYNFTENNKYQLPKEIRMNKRQIREYVELHPISHSMPEIQRYNHPMSFQGVPICLN